MSLFSFAASTDLRAQTISLAVNGTAPFSALNITSDFNAAIASITTGWITGTGGGHNYVLRVRSSNGGLTNPALPSAKISYSLSYAGNNGTSITISTTDQQIGSRSIAKDVAGGSQTASLSMSYTGTPATQLLQGVYTDTLTFTYQKTGSGGSETHTATLTLTATAIGRTIAIMLSADPVASNLPLSISQTDLTVATAFESSNSNTGYRIKARSLNGGFLKHALAGGSPGANQKINYSLKYGGSTLTLSPANTDTTVKTVSAGIYNSNSSVITLSYTAPSMGTVNAGTYSDVLTFTVEAQ